MKRWSAIESTLTVEQQALLEQWTDFVDKHIVPFADEFDAQQAVPRETLDSLAQSGILGALTGDQWGGMGLDAVSFGLLCATIGRGSASLLSLLTVQSMASFTVERWGTEIQRSEILPSIATGRSIVCVAITEPNAGSDVAAIESVATKVEGGYQLSGVKTWISFGQIADAALVVARLNGNLCTFFVRTDAEGFQREVISGMYGFKAGMLATITLQNCFVPEHAIVGSVSFGMMQVVGSMLNIGRMAIAWGGVGLAQACLEHSVNYANQRVQFGLPLRDHQLIKGLVADMFTDLRASEVVCMNAARLHEEQAADAITEVSLAKYLSTKSATRSANSALQLHGAHGFGPDSPLQRFVRDAKVMEIIEGSNQMQQIILSDQVLKG